jgi:hypothetical protein
VYFNIGNILPKYGTFLLGHPVYSTSLITFLTHRVRANKSDNTAWNCKMIL